MAEWETDQVSTWIINDGDFYEQARALAVEDDVDGLSAFLLAVLREAAEESTPWHVRRVLSDYDLDHGIDWSSVAEDLK